MFTTLECLECLCLWTCFVRFTIYMKQTSMFEDIYCQTLSKCMSASTTVDGDDESARLAARRRVRPRGEGSRYQSLPVATSASPLWDVVQWGWARAALEVHAVDEVVGVERQARVRAPAAAGGARAAHQQRAQRQRQQRACAHSGEWDGN